MVFNCFSLFPLALIPGSKFCQLSQQETVTQLWRSGLVSLGSATTDFVMFVQITSSHTVDFPSGHLQGDVIGHPLSLGEVLWLVLCDDMPGDPIVDAVLQQHGLVHGVGATQVTIAAVCL